MKSKKKLLKKSRLYVIVDKNFSRNYSLLSTVNKIKGGGVDIIQLRSKELNKKLILKQARQLRKALLKTKIILIINDYLDVAKIIDADGIHLGQKDTCVETARRVLGEDKIIGVSCHNLKQAQLAQDKGADYIGIGPIFPTYTKPRCKAIGLGLIKEIKKRIHLPFFAIGGIDEISIKQVLSSGVDRVAIGSAICKAIDTRNACKKFTSILN